LEEEEDRYEGDDTEDLEDRDIVNFVDQGYYGYVDPQSQFEADDDWERIGHFDAYPRHIFLSRWRHRLIAAWRLMKDRLLSWL